MRIRRQIDHPHFRFTAFILVGDHATLGSLRSPRSQAGPCREQKWGNLQRFSCAPIHWLLGAYLSRGEVSLSFAVSLITPWQQMPEEWFGFSYTTLRRWRVAVVCLERSSFSQLASQCLLPLSVRLAMAEIVWSRFSFSCNTAYRGHFSKSVKWECEEGTGWWGLERLGLDTRKLLALFVLHDQIFLPFPLLFQCFSFLISVFLWAYWNFWNFFYFSNSFSMLECCTCLQRLTTLKKKISV